MKGTWQTTDSGGGLVAIVAVVIILGILAGPVAAAAAALVRLMLIAVAVLAAVTVTVIGFLAWRARRHRSIGTRPASFMSAAEIRAVQARSAPRAIEAPRPEIHVHLHGVDAAQAAAIIRQQQDACWPAIGQELQHRD